MTLSRLLRISRHRIRSVGTRAGLDDDLHREVAFHFDQLVQELTADGMPPDDARHAARRAFGSVTLVEAQCRDQRRMTWLHDFWQDLVYGLGMLQSNPGFTVIAAGSLAIGIGANTAVLGVMNAPSPEASRFLMLTGSS